jgi:hypothetical protein
MSGTDVSDTDAAAHRADQIGTRQSTEFVTLRTEIARLLRTGALERRKGGWATGVSAPADP